MTLRHLVQFRRFSTTRALRKSFLSSNYKSEKLWNERFRCKLLSGEESIIKSINAKIISGAPLTNWEIDIFINISTPEEREVAQLQESANLLKQFRKSLYAHTLLPSTPHALCRLYLYSKRILSLVHLLERRVEYGIFPDVFVFNLLLDQVIDNDNYMLATRLTALVMIQEEFGINPITDNLSLFSVAKYIETRTDFEDWLGYKIENDPLFGEQKEETDKQKSQEESKREEEAEEEEEEDDEDAEYVRVPFLRNPYFDNHFDLTNPRAICGKTLTVLGSTFKNSSPEIEGRCNILGNVLQGKWSEAIECVNKSVKANTDLGSIKDLVRFYVDNLHGIDEPSAEMKTSLLSALETIAESSSQPLSELAYMQCKNISQSEESDIKQLEKNMSKWSESRIIIKKREEDRVIRRQLRAEIEAKKEELRLKEQYLYFFDNLKKSRATRIEYN